VNFKAVLPGLARQQVDLLIRLHTLDAATVPADAHLSTVTAAGLLETYRDIIKTEDAYVATALERVAALFKDVKERPPRLIHFDAELENLLVGDDGQVAAWIDWDEAALGDPGWDVAALLLSIHGAYSMPDLAARAVSDYARVTVRPLKDIYRWASALASIRWAHCAWLRMQRELQHTYDFPSCDRFIEAYDSHSALAAEMIRLAEEKSR
jgi:aminoglycoside phosphotransferase (APT) family kinase protein